MTIDRSMGEIVDIEEVTARAGIQKTLADYIRFVDTGRVSDLASLFTEQTRYQLAHEIIALERSEIVSRVQDLKALFATAPDYGRIRHHNSPAAVGLIAPDRARAFSYFTAYAAAGPDHWGTYRDELVQQDGRWLFAARVATVEGALAQSPVRSLVVVS